MLPKPFLYSKISKMEVPDTHTLTFTHKESPENDNTDISLAHTILKHEVHLTTGIEAALYTLGETSDPAVHTNEAISVHRGMALWSALVLLGEYGTVRELAESELYHWAHATGFSSARYTRPVRLNDRRYRIWLRLDNRIVGMEQSIVYTGLGNGLARVDRLWRTISNLKKDVRPQIFSDMAEYLASDETL